MTVGAKEWIGDEILLEEYSWVPIDYSAIAIVQCKILCITRENLNKFPSDVLSQIRFNGNNKIKWRSKRKVELCNSIEKIKQLSPLPKHSINTMRSSSSISEKYYHTYNNESGINSSNTFMGGNESRRLPKSFKSAYSKHCKGRNNHLFQNQESDYDLQQNCIYANPGYTRNQFQSLARKRVLGMASTFKTFYKNRMLRPTIIIKPKMNNRYNSERKYDKPSLSKNSNKLLKIENSEFIVGVRGVKILKIDSERIPTSPNFIKIRKLFTKH